MSISEYSRPCERSGKLMVVALVSLMIAVIAVLAGGLAEGGTSKGTSIGNSALPDGAPRDSTDGDGQQLPANPVHRVAQKALKGEYGKLEDWQYKAYKYALAQKADIDGLAWVTSYGPWEGFMFGEACAFGYGCADSTAAANLIPPHYYVLIELPDGWEVRRVEDCGSKRNDFLARRKGAELWIDRWVRRNEGSYITRYASIRAFKTW